MNKEELIRKIQMKLVDLRNQIEISKTNLDQLYKELDFLKEALRKIEEL